MTPLGGFNAASSFTNCWQGALLKNHKRGTKGVTRVRCRQKLELSDSHTCWLEYYNISFELDFRFGIYRLQFFWGKIVKMKILNTWVHELRKQARGRGLAKCLFYKISLWSKFAYMEGEGVKNWQNIAYVVYGCPLRGNPMDPETLINGI